MFAFNSHMSSYYVDTIRPSDAYVSVNYAINDSGNSLLPVRHWAFKPLSEPIFIVNWILQNEFQWYFNENSSIFIDKNEFEMSSANPRSARRYHEISSTHWMTDDMWPIKSIPIHKFCPPPPPPNKIYIYMNLYKSDKIYMGSTLKVNYAINDSGNSLLPVRHWAFKPLSEPIFIVNWILQNEFQWYFNENSSIFIDKNEFEMSSANPRSARRYHEISSTHWMTDDMWPIKSIPIHKFCSPPPPPPQTKYIYIYIYTKVIKFIWGRHLKYKSVFMAMNILVLIETLVIMRSFPINVPSVWWIPQRDRTEDQ